VNEISNVLVNFKISETISGHTECRCEPHVACMFETLDLAALYNL